MEKYFFKNKLIEGVIKSRPNRFIMNVEVNNSIEKCHCPSTGRIGNMKFENIPCLLSESGDKERKTKYTVEAFSLDPITRKEKEWIGINQNKANEYIGFFISKGFLSKMLGKVEKIQREAKLHRSRIDFLVNNNTYLEIKTPLKDIPTDGHPNHEENKKEFNSFERIIKHFEDTSRSIEKGKKAIFLMCCMYGTKRFEVPKPKVAEKKIVSAAKKAASKGLENWQINLKIDKEGISLIKYFKLELF
jgi:sugar fermentation stimulation protein A